MVSKQYKQLKKHAQSIMKGLVLLAEGLICSIIKTKSKPLMHLQKKSIVQTKNMLSYLWIFYLLAREQRSHISYLSINTILSKCMSASIKPTS